MPTKRTTKRSSRIQTPTTQFSHHQHVEAQESCDGPCFGCHELTDGEFLAAYRGYCLGCYRFNFGWRPHVYHAD